MVELTMVVIEVIMVVIEVMIIVIAVMIVDAVPIHMAEIGGVNAPIVEVGRSEGVGVAEGRARGRHVEGRA